MDKLITVEEAVLCIKNDIENAIKKNGVEGKNNLIRSQGPINYLHNAAKASLIQNRVASGLIHPAYGVSEGEIRITGFFKSKDQDICVFPKDVMSRPEVLSFDGLLKGQVDPYGFDLTEKTLSINVRSQLSSVAKNFDTLYERTFAEALNLHLRCPKMVEGEFYMIPVYEYDEKEAANNRIAFKKNAHIKDHIEKYISSFSALNNRSSVNGEEYKYERVCLLIVDFSKQTPKIYHTNSDLITDGLLQKNTTVSIDEMNFPSFVTTLLSIHEQRFGNGILR